MLTHSSFLILINTTTSNIVNIQEQHKRSSEQARDSESWKNTTTKGEEICHNRKMGKMFYVFWFSILDFFPSHSAEERNYSRAHKEIVFTSLFYDDDVDVRKLPNMSLRVKFGLRTYRKLSHKSRSRDGELLTLKKKTFSSSFSSLAESTSNISLFKHIRQHH